EGGAPLLRKAEAHDGSVLRECNEDDPPDAKLHATADECLAATGERRREGPYLVDRDRHGSEGYEPDLRCGRAPHRAGEARGSGRARRRAGLRAGSSSW